MFAPKRLALCLVLITVGAACVPGWRAGAQPPRGSTASADSKPQSTLQCVGVSSCTAAACHNAAGPQGSKRSEYTTWLEHDPHARAYAVLTDERSQVIVRNYRGSQGGKTPRAENDRTCLACHALSPEATGTERAYLNLDGVSCESCHGRAEKWLSIHYLPEWQTKTDQQKLSLGMTPTKNLIYRGKLCAECHIGSPKNDLNHDLYAAGHPPLYYEYSAFLGSMPKHWSEREEKARHPDLEARVWALGQVISAQAALELLGHRAEAKDNPWPEFAEYNCYACHHNLRVARPLPANAYADRRTPGSVPWNSWFTSLLPEALHVFTNAPDLHLPNRQQLGNLRTEMEKPLPKRTDVAREAQAIARELGEFLSNPETAPFAVPELNSLDEKLSKHPETAPPADWELRTQVYLARTALYRARRDLNPNFTDATLKGDLEVMRRRLEFPQGFNSPADFHKK